jgi:hypothetical protein
MSSHAPERPASAALIDGRSAFTAALRQALSQAAHERARELCFVDPDFGAWPLEDSGGAGSAHGLGPFAQASVVDDRLSVR